MADGPSPTLKTPTYLGLVFSQFLAAFNDQATHIIAVFYASDMLVRYAKVPWIDEKTVVFIVPACFVAPFFLFSPLAGVLADKYSKRNIVVFWKVAEVGMMALAMVGFLLPTLAAAGWGEPRTMAIWSAAIAIGSVFLMGTHSAFFVPAKYGIMPEILHPAVLSKGNGFLEGSSFLAQILGTSFGGLLYGPLKPTFETGALEAGSTWIIGLVLFLLAVIGAGASLFMGRVPPAARDKVLTFNPFTPLASNLSVVRRSRPLILAVIGIAFFTSMVLYLRQTLLYEGETSKDLQAARTRQTKLIFEQQQTGSRPQGDEHAPPGASETASFVPDATEAQQAEMRVAMLVAFIGLGVGVGSWLAGYLSGAKIELGLVPIGGVFIAAAASALAAVTNDGGSTWPTVTCLIMVGMAAGLYIVPLYTLLQDRAPKQSKGSLVATSNFLNSTAGLAAVAVFLLVTTVFEGSMRVSRSALDLLGTDEELIGGLERKMFIPRLLFLTAAVTTIAMLVFLRRRIPDFFLRSVAWMRSYGRVKLSLHQVHNLPATGPVILLTNAATLGEALHVVSATDRSCKFIVVEAALSAADSGERITRFFARRAGYVTLEAERTNATTWDALRGDALAVLRHDDILAIAAGGDIVAAEIEKFVATLRQEVAATVVPLRYEPVAAERLPSAPIKQVHLRLGHAITPADSADSAWRFLAFPAGAAV